MNARYDLTINKGATFAPKFTWKDEEKNLVDLTGYTARMHIREEQVGTFCLENSYCVTALLHQEV